MNLKNTSLPTGNAPIPHPEPSLEACAAVPVTTPPPGGITCAFSHRLFAGAPPGAVHGYGEHALPGTYTFPA